MHHLQSVARSVWVRGLISLALLGVVLSRVHGSEVRNVVERGEWDVLGLAVATLLAAFVLGGVRWRMLLIPAGVPVSMLGAQRSYFAGVFAASFLPGAMTGDVARVLLVGGPGTRARSTTTVLFDRFTIFAASVALAWIAVRPAGAPATLVAALGVSTVVLVSGAAVAALSLGGAIWLRRHLPASFREAGRRGLSSLRAFLTPRVLALPVAGLGLAYEVLAVLSVWLVARSLGADVSAWTIAVVTPPILILSALPISIGGLGVREASYVGLLGEVGVGSSEAALVGLLAGVVFLVASLPGALALVGRHKRTFSSRRAQAAPPGPLD